MLHVTPTNLTIQTVTSLDCPSLTAPTNGDVSYTTTTYQSVATYTCNLGYTLNGDATQNCGADGTWSGSEPTCQIIGLKCIIVFKQTLK